MGFLRKGLFVATGGLSGVAVKANSKKERAAKSLEKQTKIMQQQAATEEKALREQTAALRQAEATRHTDASERAQIAPVSAAAPAPVPAVTPTPATQESASKPFIADELLKLAALRDEGVLSDAEIRDSESPLAGHLASPSNQPVRLSR